MLTPSNGSLQTFLLLEELPPTDEDDEMAASSRANGKIAADSHSLDSLWPLTEIQLYNCNSSSFCTVILARYRGSIPFNGFLKGGLVGRWLSKLASVFCMNFINF